MRASYIKSNKKQKVKNKQKKILQDKNKAWRTGGVRERFCPSAPNCISNKD